MGGQALEKEWAFSVNSTELMTEKILKVLGSEEIAAGTSVFHLSRPAGFDYESGQTIDLTLIDPKEMDAERPGADFIAR